MRLARRAGVSFRAMSAIRPLVIRNRSPSTFNNLAFTSGFCLTRCQKSFSPSTPTCDGSSARAYSSWVRSINDAIPNIVPARTTSKVSSCPPTMPYKRILPVSNRKTASEASPRAYTVSPLPEGTLFGPLDEEVRLLGHKRLQHVDHREEPDPLCS